jgi:hypothetical protein
MIELDLGEEPEFTGLTLLNLDGYRRIAKAGPPEPLAGRVEVGGPHGFAINEARVTGDEGLSHFIAKGSGVA